MKLNRKIKIMREFIKNRHAGVQRLVEGKLGGGCVDSLPFLNNLCCHSSSPFELSSTRDILPSMTVVVLIVVIM